MRSGTSPPSMAALMAEAAAGPGSWEPRSPVEYTLAAPWAPRMAAAPEASLPATAATFGASERALASSSSVPEVGWPSATSA